MVLSSTSLCSRCLLGVGLLVLLATPVAAAGAAATGAVAISTIYAMQRRQGSLLGKKVYDMCLLSQRTWERLERSGVWLCGHEACRNHRQSTAQVCHRGVSVSEVQS